MIVWWIALAGAQAADGVAPAVPTDDVAAPAVAAVPLEISGFVKPVFSVVGRTNALPEDRLRVGLVDSKAGLILQGEPVSHWRYKVFFTVGGGTVAALTGARTVDSDNDGAVDDVRTTSTAVLQDLVRESSVSWVPTEGVAFRVGQMPVPFTSTAQSPDTALLFPTRAGPNAVFLADDDLGGLIELDGAGLVQAKAGIFNGTGTGVTGGQRGVLYLLRVDVLPLGEFGFDETNPLRSEPKVGFGVGGIWHPYRSFDSAGFVRVAVNDFRGSASVRAGVAGLTVGAEALHRVQLDDLTQRPVRASGAYAQGGWVLPIALEPIARVGWVVQDATFDPRTTVWIDAGINVYPAFADTERRDRIRVTAAFQSENRLTEGETAQGATMQLLLKY